jgi:two-component system cell cycle sensor histidine kinase/response regulator CckA
VGEKKFNHNQEEELQKSEARFRALFESFPDAVFWANPHTGQLVNCNHAAESLIELPKSKILQMCYSQLHPPEECERIEKEFAAIGNKDTVEPFTTESRIISSTGKIHIVQIRSTRITINNEPISQGVFHEISLARETEIKLRESEQMFSALFRSSPIMVALTTIKDGTYLDVNDRFLEVLGYSREEVIGKTSKELSIFVNYEERQHAAHLLQQFKYIRNLEIKFQKKTGEIQTGLFSVSITNINNQECLITTANDITAWRKIEAEKLKTDQFLATLFDNANDFIFSIDLQGNIISINKALQNISEYSTEEISKINIFNIIAPEYTDYVKKMIQKKMNKESKNTVYEIEAISKSGKRYLLELNTTLMYSEGKVFGIQGIGRDVSFRRQIAEEKLRTEKLESLAMLAGGLAHDFNNILVAILGNINLLQMDTNLTDEQQGLLTDLENASISANTLTKQLLTFAKGGNPIKKIVNIEKIIRESANFILRGSNCKPEFLFPNKIPFVEVDIGQINQVFNNLIINAAQSMPNGGIISIKINTMSENDISFLPLVKGTYIQIIISDQGTGIPEEIRPKIFDPYFTTKKGGSGLGLATVYSIIKHHNGHVTFESELGVGTSFFIYLSISEKTETEEDIIHQEIRNLTGSVLILEDEVAVQETTKKMCSKIGLQADVVASGEQILELYSKKKYDFLILDLTIRAGMGGKETIQHLLIIDPKVKAIVSSGYSDDDVLSNHRNYGFMGVLKKPYSLDQLQKTCNLVLNTK